MPATTYYVGLWGDDGNSGLTWDLAKKSIGGAVAAAASGDTILVAPGTYAEVLACGAKSLTITAIQTRKTILASGSTPSISMNAGVQVTLTGITIFPTFVASNQNVVAGAGTSSILVAIDCSFIMTTPSNVAGFVGGASGGLPIVAQVTRCLFYTITGTVRAGLDITGTSIVNGCTFDIADVQTDGNAGGLIHTLNAGSYTITNNILRCRTASRSVLLIDAIPTALVLNYNRYHSNLSSTSYVRLSGVQYCALSELRAAGYETNGSQGNPLLADIVNLAPYLPPGSTLCTAGFGGGRIGAFPAAFVYSANSNPLAWAAFVDTLMTYQSGQHALNDGEATGTFDSRILDLGSPYVITGIAIGADITPPTNIFDETNTGAHPEYWSAILRGDLNTFDPDGVAISWQEVNTNEIASPALGVWRYLQFKPKARSNGS